MNFLIIGSNHRAALELIYKSELEILGFFVDIFPAQEIFLDYYNYSIVNKLKYKLGISSIIKKIQVIIKAYIVENNPTNIIVFKGMEINPETILWIKNKGIKIYNYNPDHPFIFSGSGSGNRNVTKSIRLFDQYFSYAEDAVNELNRLGINSLKIPFGFDANGFEYNILTEENELVKACFLGNADKKRVEFINKLANCGLEIDVYGQNWNRFKMNKNIKIGSAKYGKEFWLTLQKYAVQINLLRPHNNSTHNMRSFDIPGAGGIMLAPRTPDHLTYYNDQEEIFLFNDIFEAITTAKSICKMSFEERQIIRQKARMASVIKHTYSIRIKQLLKYIEG
jgi:hypothetical protein